MHRANPLAESPHRARLLPALVAALLASAAPAPAQQSSEEERAWNEPVEPFRVAGNVYYVGAAEVASYLVTTPEGHFVLDGGLPQTAPQILANIERLGFDPADVELLPGYRLVGNDAYPEILEDYRATFRRLEAMDVDVFLANHGSFFDLHAKRARLAARPPRNP